MKQGQIDERIKFKEKHLLKIACLFHIKREQPPETKDYTQYDKLPYNQQLEAKMHVKYDHIKVSNIN